MEPIRGQGSSQHSWRKRFGNVIIRSSFSNHLLGNIKRRLNVRGHAFKAFSVGNGSLKNEAVHWRIAMFGVIGVFNTILLQLAQDTSTSFVINRIPGIL